MFEDDFRTSVEISVVFQICIIIATLEETYKITMLRDYFDKEQSQEKNEIPYFIGDDNDKIQNNYSTENIVKNELKDNTNIYLNGYKNNNNRLSK